MLLNNSERYCFKARPSATFPAREAIAICAAVLALLYFQTDAFGTPQADALSTEVLRSEIDFHRLITEMRLRNRIGTISQRRRQFLWNLSNSAPTEAGLIDATQLFFSHSDDLKGLQLKKTSTGYVLLKQRVPNRVSGGANAGQLYPQILGQEINAAGDTFELTNNVLLRIRCIKRSVDPARALVRARRLLSTIDNALQARSAYVNHLDSGGAEYQAEGAVLLDLRAMLLAQFRKAYIDARKEFAWQNSLQTADLARNAIGAMGNQISVQAGYRGNSRLNGVGNLLSELAAVGITIRPWFSLGISRLDGYLAKKRVESALPFEPREMTLSLDLARLRQLLQESKSDAISNRLDTIAVEAKLITADRESSQQQQREDKKRAGMELLRNTSYGPTKMANSALGIIAGYSESLDATQKNRLSASGNLTYVVGQGANLIEICRERFVDESEEHRLEKQGKTMKQILNARLAVLEELSSRFAK